MTDNLVTIAAIKGLMIAIGSVAIDQLVTILL
jgi:hypothetical protein